MENRGRLFQLLSQNEQRNAYHRHQAELAEQYTYWDVHSDSVRGRSIMDLMQEHLFETTGKMPTLREVGGDPSELHQHQPHHDTRKKPI